MNQAATGVPRKNAHSWPVAEDSLLTWTFLFFTVIVLPCVVIYSLFSGSIDEARDARLKMVRAELEEKAQNIERFFAPTPCLGRLGDAVMADPSRLPMIAERLEKDFPGAFRWQAWTIDGDLLPMPSGLTLSGDRMWREVAKNYFTRTEKIGTQLSQYVQADPNLRRLQAFIGPNLRVEQILKRNCEPIEFQWCGKPCLFQIRQLNETEKIPAKTPLPYRSLFGYVVFVLPDKLPREFWNRFPLDNQRLFAFPDGFPLAYMNLEKPDSTRLWKPLPRTRSFSRRLSAAFRGRHDEVFTLDRWLVKGISTPTDPGSRIFLFSGLSKILENAEKRHGQLQIFMAILLLLSLGGFFAIRSGAFSDLSLRWRIAGLFVLAIFLPTSGLLHFFSILVVNEKEMGKNILQERLRHVGEQLDIRYADFPLRYGKSLYKAVQKILQRNHSEENFAHALQMLLEKRVISKFFLSSPGGEIAKMATSSPIDKDSMNFMKLLMRLTFKEHVGVSSTDTSFGETMLDQAASMEKGSSAKGFRLSRPTELKRYLYGNYDRNIMYLVPVVNSTPRVLILEVENKVLGKAFAMEELRANRFARSRRGEHPVELYFSIMQGTWRLPNNLPLWTNGTVNACLGRDDEGMQEMEFDGEKFLCCIPKPRVDNAFRPVLLASLRPILKKVGDRRQEFYLASGFATSAAFLLGFVLAIRLLMPIRRIDDALRLVGQGNLAIELPVNGKDEIGRMSYTFNAMVQGLREKERMRAYVSETVREAVRDGNEAKAHNGEIIEATILFSDIRSFTTLCESHQPKEIFSMLNGFFGEVERRIHECKGRIDKYIGDAVMAVFLEPGPDQAFQAIEAALSMKQALAEFNKTRLAAGLFTIDIGIGISTGKVLLGDVGSDQRKDLTVIGDEVNLAARLESSSKNGRHTHIIISESTWRLVQNRVQAEEMELTTVKGKHQTVRMFEIIGI